MIENYTHALIIGNGFDLNLGLKTSYTDFIRSSYFNEEILRDNELCKHLANKLSLQNWIDIENELKYCSLNLGLKSFESEYESLCQALIYYLRSIDLSAIETNSTAYSLIEELHDEKVLILDFNYTPTIYHILKEFGLNEQEIFDRVLKMHGSVDQEEIIFGVEDKADISREHIFLKKSCSTSFKPINFKEALKNINDVTFFGHSLGETDHMYFSSFFFEAATSSYRARKTLRFFYYKKLGLKELNIQLDHLTMKEMTGLKFNNDVIMEDSSIYKPAFSGS